MSWSAVDGPGEKLVARLVAFVLSRVAPLGSTVVVARVAGVTDYGAFAPALVVSRAMRRCVADYRFVLPPFLAVAGIGVLSGSPMGPAPLAVRLPLCVVCVLLAGTWPGRLIGDNL